jgi:5-methyltetrahydrofolate--homocysteine methyltransferase
MSDFTNLLKREKTVLWDGGMGSLLLAAGLELGASPEAWNIERPDEVAKIHRAYFAAGSQVVQANTFGGNRVRLKETGCPYSVEEVNRAALKIALDERPAGCLVAGNIGPSGLSFPPVGTANENELFEVFAEHAAILASSGADLVGIETMSDLREALAALRGATSVCDLPVCVSITFRETRRGFFTIMGDPAVSSLKTLLENGATCVGANCTLSSEGMMRLAGRLRDEIDGPLIIQANAGEPLLTKEEGEHRVSYPEGPDKFANKMANAFAIGIDIIGGCCGTTPKHIEYLADRLAQQCS